MIKTNLTKENKDNIFIVILILSTLSALLGMAIMAHEILFSFKDISAEGTFKKYIWFFIPVTVMRLIDFCKKRFYA